MTALPTILLAIPASLSVLMVVTLAAGIGPMVFNTLWQTTVLQYVPEHARSRVTAYDGLGSTRSGASRTGAGRLLASAIGTSAALYACGAIEWVLAASLLLVRDVRTLRPGPEPLEAGPDAPSTSATGA